MAGRVDRRAARFQGAVNNLGKIDDFLAKLDLIAPHSAEIEQIVDESCHLIDLTFDDVAGVFTSRFVARTVVEKIQRITNWRERVAQFVRQRREEFIFASVRLEQGLFSVELPRDVPREAARIGKY